MEKWQQAAELLNKGHYERVGQILQAQSGAKGAKLRMITSGEYVLRAVGGCEQFAIRGYIRV